MMTPKTSKTRVKTLSSTKDVYDVFSEDVFDLVVTEHEDEDDLSPSSISDEFHSAPRPSREQRRRSSMSSVPAYFETCANSSSVDTGLHFATPIRADRRSISCVPSNLKTSICLSPIRTDRRRSISSVPTYFKTSVTSSHAADLHSATPIRSERRRSLSSVPSYFKTSVTSSLAADLHRSKSSLQGHNDEVEHHEPIRRAKNFDRGNVTRSEKKKKNCEKQGEKSQQLDDFLGTKASWGDLSTSLHVQSGKCVKSHYRKSQSKKNKVND